MSRNDANDDALYELKPVPLLPPSHFKTAEERHPMAQDANPLTALKNVLKKLRDK